MIGSAGFCRLVAAAYADTGLCKPSRRGTATTRPALADYVLGCMKSNGQTRDALERCSCSIDVIASIIPYDRYERAETFKSMSLTTGESRAVSRKRAGQGRAHGVEARAGGGRHALLLERARRSNSRTMRRLYLLV